nr:NAD/NADP-dependent octopine/nopaline dehydrogenase family protein [uncultured Halomonas sp.]
MTDANNVTVLGAGNAGLTAAYHFALQGSNVCLFGSEGFDEQIDFIHQAGGIHAVEAVNGIEMAFAGFQQVEVTKNIQEAVSFSKILIMPVPSFAQETLFRDMLPHLTDEHLIVLMPGNYGSLVLNRIKNEEGYQNLDITFVDAISIPWATRIAGEAQVGILGIKEMLPLAALPASRTQQAIERLQHHFPIPLTPLENVIAAGLENINFGGHPLLTTLNMGLLENFNGNFNFYKDCCSPAVARVAEDLDRERLAVGQALGLSLKTELQAMNELYGMQAESVYEINRTSETHGKLNSAPDGPQARYIAEDAAYLFAPCHEFAQLAEIKTPIIQAVLTITNAFNRTDYLQTGRTLEKMGLAGKTVEQIRQAVA